MKTSISNKDFEKILKACQLLIDAKYDIITLNDEIKKLIPAEDKKDVEKNFNSLLQSINIYKGSIKDILDFKLEIE